MLISNLLFSILLSLINGKKIILNFLSIAYVSRLLLSCYQFFVSTLKYLIQKCLNFFFLIQTFLHDKDIVLGMVSNKNV